MTEDAKATSSKLQYRKSTEIRKRQEETHETGFELHALVSPLQLGLQVTRYPS
jgi:hypothetical protein